MRRGPGETKIETDRRRIHTRIAKLRREIDDMKTARDTKRAEPRAATRCPAVAIAGYTNAGKSSLLNRLTGAGVLVEDALFATLDPTDAGARRPPTAAIYTLTDTVGFVRHLPHQLVEAFRSTLEEVADADLILHVVDGSHPDPEGQIAAVREVLAEIGADQRARAHRDQQGRRRRPDACSPAAPARAALRSWSRPAPARASTSCAALIAARAAAPGRRGRGAAALRPRRPGQPAAPARARCSPSEHAADGTRLTARVDGALGRGAGGVRRPGRRERSARCPARPGHGQVTARYGEPVTRGVVQRRRPPGQHLGVVGRAGRRGG